MTKFCKIYRKTPLPEFFLNLADWRPATLLKRDSCFHVDFVKILRAPIFKRPVRCTLKKLYGPFLWMWFNCLKARATFYHKVPRYPSYSFFRSQKDERLIWEPPCSFEHRTPRLGIQYLNHYLLWVWKQLVRNL